jgi:RNA polymerase sigma-70 factor (ECF subfamily)
MLDRQARDVSTFDRELIAGTAAGDRQAFEQIVARHAAAVFRLAKALTGDAAAAEDAMQQTFLSAYQRASTFRADASVRIWLLTIARNAAYGLDAKRDREDNVEEPLLNLGLDAGWGSDDPEAIAIAAERKGILRKALSTLSAEDQQALILRDVEGLRAAESAKILGIGEPALTSQLHRARLRLARALRRVASLDTVAQEGDQ